MAAKSSMLLLTEDVALPLPVVLSAMRDAGTAAILEDDVVVISQCESLEGKLPMESASFDVAVIAWKKPELVGEQWLQEIARVLQPGGKLLLQIILSSDTLEKPSSMVERKLLMQGFVEVQSLEMKLLLSIEEVQFITIKATKASWTAGSSYPLKKINPVPKIQVDDESDLIDEDSLLTEEDLKKPQIPIVEDCEVGSMRKACKNCTCGRAQAEEKVEKLELTSEQINNPLSACGNVCDIQPSLQMWSWGCIPVQWMPLQRPSPLQIGRKGFIICKFPRC